MAGVIATLASSSLAASTICACHALPCSARVSSSTCTALPLRRTSHGTIVCLSSRNPEQATDLEQLWKQYFDDPTQWWDNRDRSRGNTINSKGGTTEILQSLDAQGAHADSYTYVEILEQIGKLMMGKRVHERINQGMASNNYVVENFYNE